MEEKLFSASVQMTPEIYKDFYKLYYKDRLKVFNAVTSIIAILLLIAAFIMRRQAVGFVWTAIALWISVFLLVYPRMAYKKPYKRAKDAKQTTHFTFYETYVSEKTNSKPSDYNYSDLMKVVETGKYFFIYHTLDSVSIVEKDNVKENAESLAEFLKTKTSYKKVR